MTSVYFERDGERFLVRAEGHAGDVEACNYINGALYSFAGYAHNAERGGRAAIFAFETNEKDGAMLIHGAGDTRTMAAFEAAIIGIKQLEKVRPQAVRVTLAEEK